jgi:hypothetical protein
MRSIIGTVSVVALLLAQVPISPGFAQSATQPATKHAAVPDPAIVAAFKSFPEGGDQLSSRLADLIVTRPKLAIQMADYIQATPSLSYAQKVAAQHGLGIALKRMKIYAADMPVKALPPPPPPPPAGVFDPTWLIMAALLAGGVVGGLCLSQTGICERGATAAAGVPSPN